MKRVSKVCLLMFCVAMSACKQAPERTLNNEYKVMEISPTKKLLTSSYSAAITGKQNVEIRPQIAGVITEVCVTEGASVKKGQTLFIIDQTPYTAALQTAIANVESARASVATAQLTVDSKQELFNQNVVSTYDLQMAKNTFLVQKAALLQAKAQEINAQNNLSYTVIKSPVNGVAGMIPYRVGSLVNSSITTPLVTVSDDADMYAYFSMTENQILALSREHSSLAEVIKSMPAVELRLSDGSLYTKQGKIDAISGIIDQKTGAISVRATFPNPNRILRSGGSGNIIFPYNKENCIVIPQSATYEIQDKLFVYKVVNGKTVSTPVTAFDINDGKEYIIESGLQTGDVIVAEGAGLLQEGVSISAEAEKNENSKK